MRGSILRPGHPDLRLNLLPVVILIKGHQARLVQAGLELTTDTFNSGHLLLSACILDKLPILVFQV